MTDNVITLYLHDYNLYRNNLRWIYSWLTYYEQQLEIFPSDSQLQAQLTTLERMAEEYHHSPQYSRPAEVIPFPTFTSRSPLTWTTSY